MFIGIIRIYSDKWRHISILIVLIILIIIILKIISLIIILKVISLLVCIAKLRVCVAVFANYIEIVLMGFKLLILIDMSRDENRVEQREWEIGGDLAGELKYSWVFVV